MIVTISKTTSISIRVKPLNMGRAFIANLNR